ncbi:MAG: pyridoxamine 5'-phosphate oxidase family protein [Erysipelotrichaceae bacterium]|nr:pyridoxamine 5'-phosphate oxidase family protein [Erysipelotrichaceae bacterium]
MFRPILKNKNALDNDSILKILKGERRGTLAINGDSGYPYAIPINFLYDEKNNKIYFHSARIGYKVDLLKKDDKVCFTVFGNEIIKDERWAPYMSSVVIFGKCKVVNNKDEAINILRRFALKYYLNSEMVDEEIRKHHNNVLMFEISIDYITGKQVQEK